MDGYIIGMLALGGAMITLVVVLKLYERLRNNRKQDREQEMSARKGNLV